MLTTNRPGVFRGRMFNSERWHVVDPALPAETEQRWRESVASTNTNAVWGKVTAVAAWVIFSLGFGLSIYGATLVASSSPVIAVLIPLGGTIASAAIVIALYALVNRGSGVLPPPIEGVNPLIHPLQVWATDLTPREDVWAINVALSNLRFFSEMLGFFEHPQGLWYSGLPPTAETAEIAARISEAHLSARRELDAMAVKHSFTIDESDLQITVD